MLPFVVMYGLWVSCYIAGRPELLEHAKQCLAQAEALSASGPLLVAHRIVGTTYLVRGEFLTSQAHLDEAVKLYDPDRHRPLAPRFGQDIRASALVYRAWLMAPSGIS
jgi:hypothetical protein